ncbi:MAG TPA: hypothetical protein VFO07_04890 [Roseiflexaceae bacterium]|nr:hypothetical protein [Roseiflexaceae bacterium]
MAPRPDVLEEYRYDHLTWPEIDEAAARKKTIVLPTTRRSTRAGARRRTPACRTPVSWRPRCI